MNNVLIVGAGRLGKGFMGEIFDNAGWNLSFLDNDDTVIKELNNNGYYKVTVHREDRIDNRIISKYKAYSYDKDYSCEMAIINANVIAMTIYPEDFPEAIAYMGAAFRKRVEENYAQNLDVICLTNKNYLIPSFEKLFLNELSTEKERKWFREHVALRDTIVRRATDSESNSSINVRSTAVLSLLVQSPLLNDLSSVEWIEPCDNVELMKDLKVFTVNGPHVTAAFAGYLKGYTTLNETVRDQECVDLINQVHDEIYEGILREYRVNKADLDKLSIFPAAKGELEDHILRIAWDPIRKLSRNDRLTGIACICLKNDFCPKGIIKSIANGFAYDNEQDPAAMEIQNCIKNEGIKTAIVKYCGLKENSILVEAIENDYNKIK